MRVAVFGLGKFGRFVATELGRAGWDVLAMDQSQNRAQAVKDVVSEAVVGNAVDRETLAGLGLEGTEVAIVSLGQNMAGSILLTLYLKELSVERILVKALNVDHALVLSRVGATRTIIPEREMAQRLAYSLHRPDVMEFIPLGPDQAIVELEVPPDFVGRSLSELDLRRTRGLQVLAVKEPGAGQVQPVIDPDMVFSPGAVVIILGRSQDLARLRQKS